MSAEQNSSSPQLLYSEHIKTNDTKHVVELIESKNKEKPIMTFTKSKVLSKVLDLLPRLKQGEEELKTKDENELNIEICDENCPTIEMNVYPWIPEELQGNEGKVFPENSNEASSVINEEDSEEESSVESEEESDEASFVVNEEELEQASSVVNEENSEKASSVVNEEDSEKASSVVNEENSEEASSVVNEEESEQASSVVNEENSEKASYVVNEEDSEESSKEDASCSEESDKEDVWSSIIKEILHQNENLTTVGLASVE